MYKGNNFTKLSEEYAKARRAGRREFMLNASTGKESYLPALEDIIENVEIVKEEEIGLIQLPLEKIQGTYYHSRALSFSRTFKPLFDENTEFSQKWINLLKIQYDEGIREPIEVYEYLNWYYVVEGNKRVSVLKYLGAYSISAKVTRLIPKWDENNKEIRLYYEFLDFNKKTGLVEIWFTEEGRFKEFYDIIKNHKVHDELIDNKYKDFINEYFLPFKKHFDNLNGEKLDITPADAFLRYLKKFGKTLPPSDKELKNKVKVILKEIEDERSPESGSIWDISKIFVPSGKKLKVAFIYNTKIKDSAWTYSHELGRRYVQEEFHNDIETKYFQDVNSKEEYDKIMQQLGKEDYKIVFTTSFDFLGENKKNKFQNVKFVHFSGYNTKENINSYFGRLYEPRYLSGILAGIKTKTNVIGYVAPFGIPEVVMGIDAFALGAKSVNTDAHVEISWTNTWNNREYERKSAEYLINQKNADVLTHHQDSCEVIKVAAENNLYSIGYHYDMSGTYDKVLTSVVWNWGKYYSRIIDDVLQGSNFSFFDLFGGSNEIEKFWGGMKSGIVDIAEMGKDVNPQTKTMIESIKKSIVEELYHPFTGPIKDNKGMLRIERNTQISDENLYNIDWYVDNVDFE
ncbi:BMP family ABC transporter substrate-binding protein [Geotoga petraea]|uniref:BMP family ABC transporter substrate-binding protein n=1 Tax=Geotoga petraea TaxID=28234 RepID=A0A4Z0W488_9BACT|nr:BMP family ABC transporter substrate-binding protein [Geotoga petraea]TGG87864.1 BMP family ABC transporter substrate-binding protein [Geotoga petraea]